MGQQEVSRTKPYQKRPYFWYSLVLMMVIAMAIRLLMPTRNVFQIPFQVGLLFLLPPPILFFFFKRRDTIKGVNSAISNNPHKVIGHMLIPLFLLGIAHIAIIFLVAGVIICAAGGC